ncbi:hypothetical protein ABIE37_000101 [Arthrobacter bambusae]|uniref:Restriction endonuclease type IV Mrr domain-containing protein n=1 Tax=Arthrobacter bambusae TaxID=1338426 RepID=A0ABV2P178_9MICC
MLVLGKTADDKGAQLEALVRRILQHQGYKKVRLNVVGAGGNELDVKGIHELLVFDEVQETPVLCEAKAYADPVNMPTWQKFLGKLFLERLEHKNVIGMLVALSGVNGNVAGSYESLRQRDRSVFVVDGDVMVEHSEKSDEIGALDTVKQAVVERFHKEPERMDPAYYGGDFYWVVRWKNDEYSIVDAHGRMLPVQDLEALRPACEGSLRGTMLAADEERAAAEAEHHTRLAVLARLFCGERILIESELHEASGSRSTSESSNIVGDVTRAVTSLLGEPFCRHEDNHLVLATPEESNAASLRRLFLSLFEDTVRISALARFMVDHHHKPYLARMVELLPHLQAGFELSSDEASTLLDLAVLFPSVWVRVATEMPVIANNRVAGEAITPEAAESNRTSFWEEILDAVRSDFSNQRLFGFLYDYMGVAELAMKDEFVVKTKNGTVGAPVSFQFRNAIRQFDAASIGQIGPMYAHVRVFANQEEPWESPHPDPQFPLNE